MYLDLDQPGQDKYDLAPPFVNICCSALDEQQMVLLDCTCVVVVMEERPFSKSKLK